MYKDDFEFDICPEHDCECDYLVEGEDCEWYDCPECRHEDANRMIDALYPNGMFNKREVGNEQG